MDEVLLEGLEKACGRTKQYLVPLTFKAEQSRCTNYMGHIISKPTVVEHHLYENWVSSMRAVIANDTDRYGHFANFFFVSHSFGNKMQYSPSSGASGVVSAFWDINFDVIERKNIYFDLATNLFAKEEETLIWRVDPSSRSYDASYLTSILFPGASLSAANYEHHLFCHFQNLGGFRYTGKSEGGVGHLKVYMAQAYMGFKVPFFSRSSSGSRHTIDVDVNKLYGQAAVANFVSIICIYVNYFLVN